MPANFYETFNFRAWQFTQWTQRNFSPVAQGLCVVIAQCCVNSRKMALARAALRACVCSVPRTVLGLQARSQVCENPEKEGEILIKLCSLWPAQMYCGQHYVHQRWYNKDLHRLKLTYLNFISSIPFYLALRIQYTLILILRAINGF